MTAYIQSADRFKTRRSLLVVLALGGIAGPALFALLVVVQGLLRPEYSHIALPVSALAAGPHGWVQDVNFIMTGVLVSAHAMGLHLAVGRGGGSILGTALLVLSGLGLVGAGIFPATDASGTFSREVGHVVAAFVAFLSAGLGLIVTSRRLTHAPNWRGYTAYTLASGGGVLLLFLVTFVLAAPPGAPLHPWLGLLQRVTVALWFACLAVLAIRLLRLGGRKEPNSPVQTHQGIGIRQGGQR